MSSDKNIPKNNIPEKNIPEKTLTRRTEIDVARGFAIFLTVLGHVVEKGQLWSNWIFSFHMPVFFVLSGLTFRPEKYSGFGSFLKDKWKKRVIPYLIALFVGFAICMVRPLYRQAVLGFDWKYLVEWAFYYGQPRELYVGQIWFLLALFWAEVIAYGWFRAFGKTHPAVQAAGLFLLARLAFSISGINGHLPYGHRLPWKLDTGLMAAVFVLAGYYARKLKLLEKLELYEKPKLALWALLALLTGLSYVAGPRLLGYVNMCDLIYTSLPLYLGAALLGSGAVIVGAVIWKKSRFWQFCGRYSMPLFVLQTFAIYWVLEVVTLFTGIEYTPRHGMPGDWFSLAVSAAAFGLMLLIILPWHIWNIRRRANIPKNK